MRTFSVFVTGISAFTKDYRRALAVNTPRPVTMTVNEDGETREVTVPAHFPYLIVPFTQVDESTQSRIHIFHDWDISAAPVFPPDNPPHPLDQIRQTLVKFLDFQEVQLPTGSPTPPSVDLTPLNETGIPTDADRQSALWLTSMEKLGTQAKSIDPKHVVDDPTDVAAYIRFPHGKITTAFQPPFKFTSVNAHDGSQASDLDRSVAQLMVCKMEVPDGDFEVTCRNYKAGVKIEPFVIKYRGDVTDPWMVFACTSLEDAFQLPAVDEKFGLDLHFRLVYRLAQGDVTDADIVLPKSINPAPGGGGPRPMGTGRCMPPIFSDGPDGI